MSEEEIEAIEFVKKLIETIKQSKMLFDEDITAKLGIATQNTLQIVLNLIQKYQTELERLNNLNNHQSKDIKKAVDYTFELNAELEKKDKIIDKAIIEIETLRTYFSEDLQVEFIGILEILKDKKVIDW